MLKEREKESGAKEAYQAGNKNKAEKVETGFVGVGSVCLSVDEKEKEVNTKRSMLVMKTRT